MSPLRRARRTGAWLAALSAPLFLPSLALPAQAATVVASDSYTRSVTSGLGTAELGGAYTIAGSASQLSIAYDKVRYAGSQGSVFDALLKSARATDVEVSQTVTVSTMSSGMRLVYGLDGRVRDDGRGYRLWAALRGDGSVGLAFDRLAPGADTRLGTTTSVPGVVANLRTLNVKFRVQGSAPATLSAKVWVAGTAEPGWQKQVTDYSAVTGSGAVGFAAYQPVSGRYDVATFDDFRAVDVAGSTITSNPAPSPAPTSAPTASPTPSPSPTASPKPTATTSPTAAPTQSPSPTPTQAPPVNNGSGYPARGALPIGQARYPIPTSNVVFVAPWGNDSAAGSEGAPKRTLGNALASVPWGGTVVMRGGEYQESVSTFRPVTIQNYPGEAVWLDGSKVVGNWTQDGSTWTTYWPYQFDSTPSYSGAASGQTWLRSDAPMAAWPEQVFVNGRQLQQVSGWPGAGQFSVDYAAQRLRIGSNPSGAEVRSSYLKKAMVLGAPDTKVLGIGFRRYATAPHDLSTLYVARHRTLIENVVVEDNATTGIMLTSDGSNGGGVVNRVTVRRNGLIGIAANYWDGGKVTNSIVSGNNSEHFMQYPTAGGMKFTYTRGVTVDNNEANDNFFTTGIWTDDSTKNAKVTRNTVLRNGFAGIQLELTQGGYVVDNVVQGAQYGLYIFDSGHLRIRNNTVWDSVVGDIAMFQDQRRQSDPKWGGHDYRDPIPNPDNNWLLEYNVITNNVLGPHATGPSYSNLIAQDRTNVVSADNMHLTITGNTMMTKSATMYQPLLWYKLDGSKPEQFDVPAWSAAHGWTNVAFDSSSVTNIGSAVAKASALGHGTALDWDLAAAIGRPTGDKHIGSYLPVG